MSRSKKLVHITRAGNTKSVRIMSDRHLKRTINLIQKYYYQGKNTENGRIFGDDVLKKFSYDMYLDELMRRKRDVDSQIDFDVDLNFRRDE